LTLFQLFDFFGQLTAFFLKFGFQVAPVFSGPFVIGQNLNYIYKS